MERSERERVQERKGVTKDLEWGGGFQDIKAQAGVGWSHIKSQTTKGGEDNDH